MAIERIVSFLPSATELLYEFGVEDLLFGVTHECRYPQDAISKPKVISTVINSDEMTSKEINDTTCKLLKEVQDIFVLDEKNLLAANPDFIISQETCEVCAAYTNQVNKAVNILKVKPRIHSMDPHNMSEIIDSVRTLGEILEKRSRAKEITDSLEERLNNVRKTKPDKSPRVLAIEWIEPFFTAGHWVPEMIEIAGGANMISKTGEHSRRLEINEIIKVDPDIILLMPCGFDISKTVSEYGILKENKVWSMFKAVKDGNVFAVDANSFFSKPSIRTIQGVEILAKIIQPERFANLQVPEASFVRV